MHGNAPRPNETTCVPTAIPGRNDSRPSSESETSPTVFGRAPQRPDVVQSCTCRPMSLVTIMVAPVSIPRKCRQRASARLHKWPLQHRGGDITVMCRCHSRQPWRDAPLVHVQSRASPQTHPDQTITSTTPTSSTRPSRPASRAGCARPARATGVSCAGYIWRANSLERTLKGDARKDPTFEGGID